MSRRGRGGYGGRSKAGTARIGGIEIAYDDEIEEAMKNRAQPIDLFPSYKPVEPRPMTDEEKARVATFLDIRRHFREGPLFTILAKNEKGSDFNPFDGMPTYSQKYKKPARRLPELRSTPRVLSLLPKELWSVYGPGSTRAGVTKSRRPDSRLQDKQSSLYALDDDEEVAENPDDAEVAEEEMDDEYESDEDEMAGDYNAEQYFDDGGEDAGDDYDAGDGDGGDAFG